MMQKYFFKISEMSNRKYYNIINIANIIINHEILEMN